MSRRNKKKSKLKSDNMVEELNQSFKRLEESIEESRSKMKPEELREMDEAAKKERIELYKMYEARGQQLVYMSPEHIEELREAGIEPNISS